MNEEFSNRNVVNINDSYESIQSTIATFRAFVDAIVPITPFLAQTLGEIQYSGALNLHTYLYLIWSLDHIHYLGDDNAKLTLPLSIPTANLLDIAARQLIFSRENQEPLDFQQFSWGGAFAALAQSDRLRAVSLLEQLKVDLSTLPIPYLNNPDNVLIITYIINALTMMGYYSEWSGYGSTRLYLPNERVLEYFPISWEQVSYPGPSRGYPDFRGYLVDNFI